MNGLSKRELHLVSLGAAIGCNCIPCTVYHLKECKANGVADNEIAEAVRASNKVKSVPADNVTKTALRLVETADADCAGADKPGANGCSCGCA